MLQRHTHQELGQLSRSTEVERVARNPHGQSLDEAREAFRAEWQAQIERQRGQAAKARRLEAWCSKAPRVLLIGGAVVGACVFALLGVFRGGLPDFIMAGMLGGTAGLLVLLPFALLALLGQCYHQLQAERLERKLRELEQS